MNTSRTNKHIPEWVKQFSGFDCDDPVIQKICTESANVVPFDKGAYSFREGDKPQAYLLVANGTVRVQKISRDGREIMLYRVHKGQGCALTTACILSGSRYPAEGICETMVTAITIPKADFVHAFNYSDGFRAFVCAAYGSQYGELINLVTDIAFEPLNMRLARQLLQETMKDDLVRHTHRELAIGLGSVREVVSRELNVFRDLGWVELERGYIRILNKNALIGLLKSIPMCRN